MRDCNWASRDPGSGKNALAVLESCLLIMLSLVGAHWENVEYIKTLVAALVTWQRWHSRTPSCIHSEEYGEAMCIVPGLDYHNISQWHLGNFCNVDSDPNREEEPAVLTNGEVCDAGGAIRTPTPPPLFLLRHPLSDGTLVGSCIRL